MKKILGALAVALMIGACANTTDDKEEKVEDSTEQTEIVEEVKADEESSSEESEVVEESESKEEEPKEEESKEDDVPREYEVALRSANSYLDSSFLSFSETGLYDQLEYEEFPADAIEYAMANIEVDWNEQAIKTAQNYADSDLLALSDAEIYDQLIFEGFTEEQAQIGLDSLYE